MKELRFHPQFGTLLASTAEDSFNVFRPNLEPVEERDDRSDEEMQSGETMSDATGTRSMVTTSADEESKQ